MRVAAFAMVAFAVGCGPTKVTPKAEVTGTVGGANLKETEVILGEVVSDRGRIDTLYLSVSESTGACELAKANKAGKSTVTMRFVLMNDKGDTLNPGVYPIITGHPSGSSGNYAKGGISKFDAACADAYSAASGAFTSGTVTLTTHSEGGSATGSFDVSIGAEKLTGTFAANVCAGFTQAMVDTADSCS